MQSVEFNNKKYNINQININTINNHNILLIHNKRDYQKYNVFNLVLDKNKKTVVFNPYKNQFYNNFSNHILTIDTNELYKFNQSHTPNITILDDCNDFDDNDVLKITNQKITSTFDISHFTDELIKHYDYIIIQKIKKKCYNRLFLLFNTLFDNDFDIMLEIINHLDKNNSFIVHFDITMA